MDCYNLNAKINIGKRLPHINKLIIFVALVYKFPPHKSCVICHQKTNAVDLRAYSILGLLRFTLYRLNTL